MTLDAYLMLIRIYWCSDLTFYIRRTEVNSNNFAHLRAVWRPRSSPAAAPTVAPGEGAPCWRGVQGERRRHGLVASSLMLRRLAVPRQPIDTAVLIITAVSCSDILNTHTQKVSVRYMYCIIHFSELVQTERKINVALLQHIFIPLTCSTSCLQKL